MKHLLLITTSYPDQRPGSEAAGSFVADFAEALSRYLRVSVVAPAGETSSLCQGNLHLHRFAVPFLPLSLLSLREPRHWPRIIGTLRAGKKAVEALARQEKIDHILALWALPSGSWARSIGKKYQIPYSVWALGSDIWSLSRIPVVNMVLRTVLRESRLSFADGYLLQRDVEKLTGRPCAFLPSTRRLPLSGLRQFAQGPPYRLAFLGRWHHHKGTDLLCAALGALTDEDWGKIAEVRICGGGPLEGEVQELCTGLREAGRPVTAGGYLDKEGAAELLSWADYLLIPSRIESIPVVFSDALQARCPVIAMPVGDLPRLLEEWPIGVLAEEVTPAAYARAIRAALRKAPLSYAGDLEKAVLTFDVEKAAESFLQMAGFASSEVRGDFIRVR